MKVSKKNKNIIIFFILFLFLNFKYIYKNLDNKEERLLNQIKIIKKLEDEKNKEIKEKNKEDLVISIQNYFKDVAFIKYIRTDHNSQDEIEIEGEIIGDKNLIAQSIKNMNSLSENISLDSIKVTKMDENTIDFSFKVKAH